MFTSRSALKLLILLSLVGFIQSCGLGVFEDPPRAVPMVLKDASLGCSVNIFEREDSYFQGESTDSDIQEFWSCTQSALTLFMKHTRGSEKGQYSASELKNFLETYFLDSRAIPMELFNEAMNLRVGIMGGSRNVVTKEDMEALIKFTELIRVEMLRLRPYMPLQLENFSSLSEDKIENLVRDLQLSLNNTGLFFLKFSGSYKFTSLDLLLDQLSHYLENSHKGTTIASSVFKMIEGYQKFHKFIKLAKETFIPGTPPDSIEPKDFEQSFKKLSLVIETLIRFQYWDKKYHLDFQGEGLDFFEKVLISLNGFIVHSLKAMPDSTLSFNVMDQWIDLLDEKKWVPLKLTKISVKNILRPIVRSLLGGQDFSSTGRNASGLTLTAHLRAMEQISVWLIGQKHLRSLYEGQKIKNRKDLLAATQAFNQQNPLKLDKIKSFIYNDIYWVIKTQRPLFYGDETYVSFPEGHMSQHNTLSLSFLSQIHWMRALGRFAISGYTQEKKLKTPAEISRMGLNMKEFQQLYKDLTEIGIQLKFIFIGNKPEDYENFTDSGSKRFRESNLFMSRSDGGHYAHMDEAVEYFSFLFSIKALSEEYFRGLSQECGTHLEEDIFGTIDHFIDAKCFSTQFYERIMDPEKHSKLNFKKSMPRLVKYYAELSEEDKTIFKSTLEKASRLHSKTEDAYERADLESYIMILQYVETAFLKYDYDSNEILDEKELTEAYTVFYVALKEIIDTKMPNILKKVEKYSAGQITEDMTLHLIYTYLLYHKKPPSFNMAAGAGELIAWWRKRYLTVWPEKKPVIEASRITFLSVMSTLGEATLPTGKKEAALPESVTLAK